eukprot:gene28454-34351_t
MYIQEIIIDGFKSYAQKTVVSGFDPQFNAITGLNGTGKSNILDSICFVLGIQNLSQVRVGNLQELVYKQGQAGVTKASVTIIFNNSDPATSPVGYESHKQITVTRQVVIGGKNKYMVNGHTVQQQQVQNLFHSVQLNVNNPHFLIMQGRITKVLNMKPPEILSMIEEAAGTRMFENKKQASLKTIEKKQLKVDEITKCIEEEITPTLESLRTERQDYHTWQSNNAECERLEKFCVAFEVTRAQQLVTGGEKEKAKMAEKLADLANSEKQKNVLVEECKSQIQSILAEREEMMEGDVKVLKRKEAEVSKDMVKLNTLLSNHQESVKSEEDTLDTLKRQIQSLDKQIEQKKDALVSKQAAVKTHEDTVQAHEKDLQQMREKLANARAGVANEFTAELLSLPDQIMAWEKVSREGAVKIAQANARAQHLESALAQDKKATLVPCATHRKLEAEQQSLKDKISSLEREIASVANTAGNNNNVAANPSEQLVALRREASQLQQSLASLEASVSARLNFEFTPPSANFNMQSVVGPVARCFTISNPTYATALEVTAAGKLTQIVVDTEETGKLLLKRGGLKRRVTILPLNRLVAKEVDERKLALAKKVAKDHGGEAYLASELVSFPAHLSKVITYVYGNTIVCSTPQIARDIAFHKDIKVSTVTLMGDVYEPKGTLSGGSAGNVGTLLLRMYDMGVKKRRYEEVRGELEKGEELLRKKEEEINRLKDMQQDLEMSTIALTACTDKLKGTAYSQKIRKISEKEQELQQIQQEMKDTQETLVKAERELVGLRAQSASAQGGNGNKLKEFERSVEAAQQALQQLKAAFQAAKLERDTIVAEIKSLEKEKGLVKEQEVIAKAGLEKMRVEAEGYGEKLAAMKAVYEEVHAEYMAKQAEYMRKQKEIVSIEQNMEKYVKETQALSLEIRKMTHSLKSLEKDMADSQSNLAKMMRSYPWIEREKEFFGVKDTDYDFSSKDIPSAQKRLKDLKADQERLSRKINKKVMGMIETAEAEYAELTHKRQVILNDKAKIESVISELDIQKVQALQKTYTQVNRDFGSIFSMLLPGVTAKLSPADENVDNLMEGLEVKVAFNNVWKDSLTELSGGQRSLLALSLILALLLYKPAPMYILDEVDAALDLSHTQNIGLMIKTHFSRSQFIVVSLKEGMFNNANVIFRTKFVDGVSCVTRTVAGMRAGAGSPPLLKGAAENEEDNFEGDGEEAPAKKRGKKVGGGAKRGAAQSAVEAL